MTALAWWVVLGLSAAPVFELRGGIPYGISQGLSPGLTFLVAVIGNLAVVPILLLGFEWAERGLRRTRWGEWLCEKTLERARRKGRWIERWGPIGLVLLVAIPLPGTGAWTGAVVARVLGIGPRRAFPWIAIGVLIAGTLVLFASLGAFHLVGLD